MNKACVSVLINAYNSETYIAAAIDSALAQTYSRIEVIVLDDHSTDRTGDIVKSYAASDSRVRYILPAKRLGLVEGRNELLRHVRGEYFTYLDADDIYLPDKVDAEVGFLAARPEFAIVYCNIGYFFDDESVGGVPKKIYRHRYHFYSDDSTSVPGEMFSRLLEKMFITNTATMFRTAVYRQFGGYRTDLGIVEDWEYFLRVTYGGVRIGFLDRDLVRYRLRWDNHTNFKKQAQVQESAVRIFEDLKWRMAEADRQRYSIDYWIARRNETYAIALIASGRAKEAREALGKLSGYLGLAKRAVIWLLSFSPAFPVGFLIERAWKMRKKSFFVPLDGNSG